MGAVWSDMWNLRARSVGRSIDRAVGRAVERAVCVWGGW